MRSILSSTLLKLAIPVATIMLVLLVSRLRGLSWQHDLGLSAPRLSDLAVFVGIWLVWMAVSEWLSVAFGLDQARAWPAYTALIVGLRILAIGVLGPFAEELMMRGLLYSRLRRTALGDIGAILISAVGWSALHFHYGIGTLGLITLDGLILGLARYRSGTVWIPAIMHMMGNLFSIYQSLSQ